MRLLIIGNINSEIKTAIDIAQERNSKVVMVDSINQAIDFLCQGKGADLVLVDVQFDIASLISLMKNEKISTPVIAYGVDCPPKAAVIAIKAGAKEFLPLPPDERLIAAIFTSISDSFVNIIGESAEIKSAIAIADKVAPSDANILITGPSGSGKEVFANYIHNKSKRKDQHFVAVNCAAIPESLLESELFGHEKGAFTGALSRRIGKFEEASGGTLLLDEISEMDARMQAKLLRAIQEKEINRVGGGAPVKVNLRIIATSNRDLPKEIIKGTFREDLYFRLNIINIDLPPLSTRSKDIIILGQYFADKYTANNNLEHKSLSEDATNKMLNYKWPGNVRELENVMHRAVLLSTSNVIEADDVQIKEQASSASQNDTLVASDQNSEKQLLFNTIGYCIGDLNKAANILGISINILKEKLEYYTKV